jgi:hypothetical protein
MRKPAVASRSRWVPEASAELALRRRRAIVSKNKANLALCDRVALRNRPHFAEPSAYRGTPSPTVQVGGGARRFVRTRLDAVEVERDVPSDDVLGVRRRSGYSKAQAEFEAPPGAF